MVPLLHGDLRIHLHELPAMPHGRVCESAVTETSDLLPLVRRLRQGVGLVDLERIGSGRSVALDINAQERSQVGILGRVVTLWLGTSTPWRDHTRGQSQV